MFRNTKMKNATIIIKFTIFYWVLTWSNSGFVHGFRYAVHQPLFGSRSRSLYSQQHTICNLSQTTSEVLTTACNNLNEALESCNDVFKDVKVQVAPTATSRCGLVATQKIRKGESVVSIPFADDIILTPKMAKSIFALTEDYNSWTGDNGLLALVLLHEVSIAYGANPSQRGALQTNLMKSWIASLPTLEECRQAHPLLWKDETQEVLQKSSTKKICQIMDDIEDDFSWLESQILSKDKSRYPQVVGNNLPCFSLEGFQWAMAMVSSRAAYLDGMLRLVPIVDFANHNDVDTEEVQSGYFGTFGTTAGVQIKASRDYDQGDEVFVSYGPKSAAEYLLDHGFIPPQCYRGVSVAELTFELDENDRFQDDKLDILEFETYEQAPMEPIQSFDVVATTARDVTPDPVMLQFLRLIKLGGTDAFLLESIFRKEVWGFMSQPVSQKNELEVVNLVIDKCTMALKDMDSVAIVGDDNLYSLANRDRDMSEPITPEVLCATVRAVERRAFIRMKEFMERDRDALDLKEYYQERRLKDLGLDSAWDPENSDVGWSSARKPGGGELDW